MKALAFTEHGDVSKMAVLDFPQPEPGPGEALIQIKACAFNHLDIWVREGWPGLKLKLPHIVGSDAAGIVVALGPGVKSVSVGDRVAIDPGLNLYEDEFTARGKHSLSPGYKIRGEHIPGTHTEYLVVSAHSLLPIPDQVSFETAAAAGLVSLTAWRMLIHRAQLKAGESVLVLGAGGGVNGMAIQIAKLAGCTVYATTSTDKKAEQAKAIGADIVLNYQTNPDWSKTIYQLTEKKGVDVVVDNIGSATLSNSIRAVKRGGRVIIVGNTSGPITELDIRFLFTKQISLIGSTMGNHDDYRTVMNLVFQGKIKPIIHTVLPLSQGSEAMALLERGEQFGKVVLKP